MKKVDRNTIPLSNSTELEERLSFQYVTKLNLERAMSTFEYSHQIGFRNIVDLKHDRVCKRIARMEKTLRIRGLR